MATLRRSHLLLDLIDCVVNLGGGICLCMQEPRTGSENGLLSAHSSRLVGQSYYEAFLSEAHAGGIPGYVLGARAFYTGNCTTSCIVSG